MSNKISAFSYMCVFGCMFTMAYCASCSWDGRHVPEHNWEFSSKKTNNEMSHNIGAVEARRRGKKRLTISQSGSKSTVAFYKTIQNGKFKQGPSVSIRRRTLSSPLSGLELVLTSLGAKQPCQNNLFTYQQNGWKYCIARDRKDFACFS